MRFKGFNWTKSQKSTYSFFEEIADINVLDEASDEEDLNSLCESRVDEQALITVDELIMTNRLEEEYDTPMEQSLVDDNEFANEYENGFEATFEMKSQQFCNPSHHRFARMCSVHEDYNACFMESDTDV